VWRACAESAGEPERASIAYTDRAMRSAPMSCTGHIVAMTCGYPAPISARLAIDQRFSVSAVTTHRNPVTSSHMDAAASLNDDGVARRNGLVQAPLGTKEPYVPSETALGRDGP